MAYSPPTWKTVNAPANAAAAAMAKAGTDTILGGFDDAKAGIADYKERDALARKNEFVTGMMAASTPEELLAAREGLLSRLGPNNDVAANAALLGDRVNMFMDRQTTQQQQAKNQFALDTQEDTYNLNQRKGESDLLTNAAQRRAANVRVGHMALQNKKIRGDMEREEQSREHQATLDKIRAGAPVGLTPAKLNAHIAAGADKAGVPTKEVVAYRKLMDVANEPTINQQREIDEGFAALGERKLIMASLAEKANIYQNEWVVTDRDDWDQTNALLRAYDLADTPEKLTALNSFLLDQRARNQSITDFTIKLNERNAEKTPDPQK